MQSHPKLHIVPERSNPSSSDLTKHELRFQARHLLSKYDRAFFVMKRDHLLFEMKVLDLSSQGALLLAAYDSPTQRGERFANVAVSLNGREIAHIPNLEVKSTRASSQGLFVGVQFILTSNDHVISDLRSKGRAKISHCKDSKLVVEHPINFNDKVLFKVENISSDGMLLSTSLRNRFMLPGMTFEKAKLSLGAVVDVSCSFTIAYCRLSYEDERIYCGVRLKDLASSDRHTIGGYLMSSQSGSLEERLMRMASSGFRPKLIKSIAEFTFASSTKHLEDLKALRWRAYVQAGKVSSDTSFDSMLDHYDQRSTIVVAYIGQDLVASVRLTECRTSEDRFEIESEVDLKGRYDRFSTFEISRMCVVPELQGTDLVHAMMEHAVKLFIQSNKKWIITSCTDDLLSFYQRIGYRSVGISYRLKALNNTLHYIIEANPEQVSRGTRINPIYWFYTYSKIQDYLVTRGYIQINWFTKLRLKAYRVIGQFVMRMMKVGKS